MYFIFQCQWHLPQKLQVSHQLHAASVPSCHCCPSSCNCPTTCNCPFAGLPAPGTPAPSMAPATPLPGARTWTTKQKIIFKNVARPDRLKLLLAILWARGSMVSHSTMLLFVLPKDLRCPATWEGVAEGFKWSITI